MKTTTKILIGALFFTLAGCTDAERSRWGSYGSSATVQCFSGGTVIYDGKSTGKVLSESGSDGYFFRDQKDNRLKEVSGDCIVTYDSN